MGFLTRAENALGSAALLLMAAFPVLEIVLRGVFKTGIPGSTAYAQNLALWVGFIGAMIAAREGTHLKLTGAHGDPRDAPPLLRIVRAVISASVAVGLAWASMHFMWVEMESPILIGGWLPAWAFLLILPVSFAVMALRFTAEAGPWAARAMAFGITAVLAAAGALLPAETISLLVWPAIAILVAGTAMGVPIFAILGGAALMLLAGDDVPIAAIPVEAYRIVVSPAIPTIPLFVLTGYLLAEGKAGERLVRLFGALFGWIPGGLAIVVTLVCAFFSTFTGASGVTIIALGGLLLPVLVRNAYPERFSLGLLTASGSIGLLFPPSLAVILYGVVAHVSIPDLFLAGVGPGLIMVAAVCVLSVAVGLKSRTPRTAFDRREALAAIIESKWEIALPPVAIAGIFGGWMTLFEAAAVIAVYAFITQCLIHRDVSLGDTARAAHKSVLLVGGVFVILGAAMGLTNYLVDAQVPMHAAAWVEANVDSRILFLISLNLFLLAVGCMMDIYAATVVVVPLIVPMAAAFGIHPLHLGMIFLVNLQLGYLTPPVGMNLFLAAYRFDRPVTEMARAVLPFLAVLFVVLMAVTYVPWISLIFVKSG